MSGNATNIGKLYDVMKSGQAPAVVGKPVFEKDIEAARMLGANNLAQLFGARDPGSNNDSGPMLRSLNFGSKASTGFMNEETRVRLFLLKQLISDVEIQAQIMTRNLNPSADAMMATPLYKARLEPMLKAFNITDFSSWIPTVNARFYFEEFELPLLLSDSFDQMPMDSATVNVPGALGLLFGHLETDVATFAAQANTQSNYTVSAKNNVVHAQISEDLMQDSAPAVLAKLRYEVVKGVARSADRTLINGDDTGSHMDADVTAGTDFRKAYKGLRKLALANTANGSVIDQGADAPNLSLFKKTLKASGKFASEKGDMLWIAGPSICNDLVAGAIPELFTAFAFGGPASNRTGQVPPVFGINMVESEYVREDLDGAAGVYASGGTKTTLILVKKSRFANFLRAPLRVWAAPSLPSSDQMLMSAKMRHAFAGVPQTATEKSVVIATNIETVPS